jgi:hypothetical protein
MMQIGFEDVHDVTGWSTEDVQNHVRYTLTFRISIIPYNLIIENCSVFSPRILSIKES